MKKRKAFRLGITLMLAGAFVSAVLAQAAYAQDTTGATGATSQSDDQKVVFTWAGTGEPDSLNPMTGYSAIEFYFWTASLHLLVDFDTSFGSEKPDPAFDGFNSGLVTDIQVSDDSMHYTYAIRDDLFWSDGEPVTADDVAYTLNLYKNNHAYLPVGYTTLIDGEVTAPDATHVEFDTTEPTGLYNGDSPYVYAYILPKHIFEQTEQGVCPGQPEGERCSPKAYSYVPQVGSGPFVMAEYKVGEFVRMERNPYWPGPKPAIDEIIYRIYKNDDAIATALQTGEIDFGYVTTANIFNTLKNADNVDTMVGSIPSFSEIALNSGSAYEKAEGAFTPHGDGHPALADPVVRQAIRMAIDSEQLNRQVLLGYGVPGDTLVPPVSVAGARWEPTGADKLGPSIDGAKQMLENAGYIDSDGDGIREMPAGSPDPGRPLDFRYYVRTSEQTSVDAAPFVSEWLQQIGIKTEVTAVNSAKLTDIINAGEYELSSWGWYPDPDPASILSYFTCDQRPPDGSTYGNNDAYYCNPEYDKLYQEQLGQTDANARWDIVHQMQKIFYEDSPYVIMWYDPVFSAWRSDRFTGYIPQPQPNGDPLEGWGGISEVWLSLHPVAGSAGGSGAETKGISPAVWAIVAGVIVLLIAVFVIRRRRAADEDV
jgi:peptide/nickel transport system substrate-binding protein